MAKYQRIGLLGAGQMGSALLRGLLSSGVRSGAQARAFDVDALRLAALEKDLSLTSTPDAGSLAVWADVLVLATKPSAVPAALASIAPQLSDEKLVVSIAAGYPLKALQASLPSGYRVLRAMPNTPALVGAGVTAIAASDACSATDRAAVGALFASVGVALEVPETQLDAITGLSGSGPAFVFLLLEALADGGVAVGLPRDVAQQIAAQTLLGAAKMAIETGQHPALLRNQVTSPAGTTAAGLQALESRGVRAALVEAVQAATARAGELSQQFSVP